MAQQKIIQDFGETIAQIRPDGISYQQQYDYLHDLSSRVKALGPNQYDPQVMTQVGQMVKQALTDGRLDALLLLQQLGVVMRDYVESLVGFANLTPDHIRQLQLLGALNNKAMYSALIPGGNLHNANLLAQAGVQIRDDLAEWGSVMNDVVNYTEPDKIIPVLEWLEQRGHRPTQETARIAALDGYTHVLDWLERRGVLPPTGLGAETEPDGRSTPAVGEWLARRGLL